MSISTWQPTMDICRWCERPIPQSSRHCPYCGQVYEDTIPCSKCGLPVSVKVRLCGHCGHFIDYPEPGIDSGSPPEDDTWQVAPADDSISAWPGYRLNEEKPVQRTKEYFPADPIYYVALLLAVLSFFFVWLTGFNIVLAGLSILLSLVGYYRLRLYGERYGQIWGNIVATALGISALIFELMFQVRL